MYILDGEGGPAVVCYYDNWVIYRPGDCQFEPSDIDPELCTHIIYAYAKLQATENPTLFPSDEWADLPSGLGNAHIQGSLPPMG